MKLIFIKFWCFLCSILALTGIIIPWLISNNFLPLIVIIVLSMPLFGVLIYTTSLLSMEMFCAIDKYFSDKDKDKNEIREKTNSN